MGLSHSAALNGKELWCQLLSEPRTDKGVPFSQLSV